MKRVVTCEWSDRDINNIFVLTDLRDGFLKIGEVPTELDVDYASFATLENDVLELLNVPLEASKYSEGMSKNSHFIEMPDCHLVKLGLICLLINTVLIVNGSLRRELLDNAYSFLSNSGLRLLR